MSHTGEYSYEDYRGGMPPRAFGSETEYTSSNEIAKNYSNLAQSRGDVRGPDLVNFIDPRHLVSIGRHVYNSAVVTTGGELYIDIGALIEYATPECLSPAQVALHERAGEQIVLDTATRLANHQDTTTRIYKRSGYAEIRSDGKILKKEDSVGHHENYTSLSVLSDPKNVNTTNFFKDSPDAQCFADFLALRKLIDGAGMVADGYYSITQKPSAINYRDFTCGATHRQKRPFRTQEDRFEVRSGEGSKSDWATEFKYGLTSLVLRLIEHDKYPKHLALMDPTTTVRFLSEDPLANTILQSGLLVKGADVLKQIVDTAVEIGQASPDFPKYEQKAAKDFYKFYDDLHNTSLKDNDVASLSDRINWAARFEYLVERGASHKTITSAHLDQVRDDLKWDEIGTNDVARRHFSKFGHTAIFVPIPTPPHTRAESRVRIARRLYGNHILAKVDWGVIRQQNDDKYILPNVMTTEESFVTAVETKQQWQKFMQF